MGSIVFEAAFPTLHAYDCYYSSYIFNLELGHLDYLIALLGVSFSLFWTFPGLFIPLVLVAVTPYHASFFSVSCFSVILCFVQSVLALQGHGKFSQHSLSVIFYAPLIAWAAFEYTNRGLEAFCYIIASFGFSIAALLPLKWEFHRERPIVWLKRNQLSEDEANRQDGIASDDHGESGPSESYETPVGTVPHSASKPWEERRESLFHVYLRNISGGSRDEEAHRLAYPCT